MSSESGSHSCKCLSLSGYAYDGSRDICLFGGMDESFITCSDWYSIFAERGRITA